jgi:hypothetical protein
MDAAGLIPEPPEEIQGVALRVEYLSILAQAQKLVGVVAQDRFLNSVAAMAQTFPSVVVKVDEHQAVDNYGEMLGVDPRLVRSNEDAQAMQEAAQRQQAMAADAETASRFAQAGKLASETPLDTDNALTRLLRNAGSA